MNDISFTLDGWDEYIAWQVRDKRALKKINALIKDIIRHPFKGIGHPEPLRGNLSGYWSRTIDEKNRLTYMVLDSGKVLIAHCGGHYGDT
jgi:toxin YoeB